MRYLMRFMWMALAMMIAACGGGGGSPGTPSGGSNTTPAAPTVALSLLDAANTALTSNTLTSGAVYYAQALVKNSAGNPVANQLVAFTTADTTLLTLSPAANATTDAQGVARVQLTPLATGASTLTASATVSSTQATASVDYSTRLQPVVVTPVSISFVSATPALLVVTSAPNGSRTSIVRFQVLSDQAAGVAGQSVVLSLNSQSIDAGVAFATSVGNSSAPQTLTSDASGNVQISLVAGAFPTPVVVTAALSGSPAIRASTSSLSVTNGKATQSRASLSAVTLSVEAASSGGASTDGVTTSLTIRLADRLGNPVPDGTTVNFVASHGRVDGSCVTAASACSVTWTSQAARPSNGLFTVLAYVDGEESFVDINGNNRYDAGEDYQDLGQLYLDLNADQAYNSSIDQIVSNDASNNAACFKASAGPYGIPDRCDGRWSDSVRVRSGNVLAWASSQAQVELTTYSANVSQANPFLRLRVSSFVPNGGNLTAVPSGSTFAAAWSCPTGVAAPTDAPRLSIDRQPNASASQLVTLSFDKLTANTTPATPPEAATVPGTVNCTVVFTVTSPGGTSTTTRYPLASLQ